MPQSRGPSRRLRSIIAARSRAFLPLLVALSLVACGGQASAPARPGRPGTAPDARHIFLIVMENKEESDVPGSTDAPYLNQLAARYAVADRYYAIRHPSLPNYLALLGGDTFGVDSDCTDCFQDAPNLADSLEAKGLTWASYQEDLPSPCSLVASTGGGPTSSSTTRSCTSAPSATTPRAAIGWCPSPDSMATCEAGTSRTSRG